MLIAALVVLYVITCVRVAIHMRRLRRSPVRWFFITFFFTAIPASVVFLWHNFAWLRRGKGAAPRRSQDSSPRDDARSALRCPRCRRWISLAELPPITAPSTCPHCGSLLDEEPLG